MSRNISICLLLTLCFITFASPAAAFGAGNIASISKIEGHNWRHGDIEDLLKTVAFLKGHKWTSMMIKRAYFGNFLRDYSQAVDVGTLKGIQGQTITILVWVLSFLSFGYATGEFQVTEERLGVYRPEEHIDNPKDYADNVDARQYDPRLRPPVSPEELAIDPRTAMKNYIANEQGNWATSSGYVRYSFGRSIHFGRVYTNGANGTHGREADLCEALRCLGQGLHCLEDFGAHTNYTELVLRELGLRNVFPHTGSATEVHVQGRPPIFPLVTGTFGGVDFLHSVLGEATDHFTQSEIDEMDIALGDAQVQSKKSSGTRGPSAPGQEAHYFTSLLSQVPGLGGGLCQEAERLQADADAQERTNTSGNPQAQTFAGPPGSTGGPPGPGVPGLSPNFDPAKTVAQIYPILEFRDRVVRAISATIEKIPGLQSLVDKITETLTLFILSLLAPFIRPIINAVSKQLKEGSSTVVNASGQHQYEVWTDPHCSDPTHSLLSKDHFSNVLNPPAGQVAGTILQYAAPRVIYAWQHPEVPVEQVLDDVVRVFHHPALRDQHCEIHRSMFDTVKRWVDTLPDRGSNLNNVLSAESVRAGKNHKAESGPSHGHHGHSKVAGSQIQKFSFNREIGGDDFAPQGQGSSGMFPDSQYHGGQAAAPYESQAYPASGGLDPQYGTCSQQPPLPQSDYGNYPEPTPQDPSYQSSYQQTPIGSYPQQSASPYPPAEGNYGAPQYSYDPNVPPPNFAQQQQEPSRYGAPQQGQGDYGGGQYYGHSTY